VCYIHLFNGLFSRTTWVSRHQKGKAFWILMKQEMTGCQWHQLDHITTYHHIITHTQLFYHHYHYITVLVLYSSKIIELFVYHLNFQHYHLPREISTTLLSLSLQYLDTAGWPTEMVPGLYEFCCKLQLLLLHSTPLKGWAVKPQRQGHIGGPIAQP